MYYINSNKIIEESKKEIQNEILDKNQNNLIRNLIYEVKFDNNTQYIISAELSELVYENDIEIVKMQKVNAKFVDENNMPLIITSKNAIYNNSNYNTEFSRDVMISYENNTVNSGNLDLNFVENLITIYNNVVYEGSNGLAKTDNIKINLITKQINIFMNDAEEKVELISK
jgi:CRISPR/Cas system CMR subunit Cmr4 (Cas7 group RAMP superfamily)